MGDAAPRPSGSGFAGAGDRFGFKVGMLSDWEQGRGSPDATTRTLLLVIEGTPELVARIVLRVTTTDDSATSLWGVRVRNTESGT